MRISGIDDFESLLAMKSDHDDVTWSGFACAPERLRFRAWFDQARDDPDRIMYTGFVDDVPAGYVHFSRTGQNTFNIATGVLPAFRGRGLAPLFRLAAMAHLHEKHPGARVEMWIADRNVPSQKSWAKVGYTPTTETREREYLFPIPRIETQRLWVIPDGEDT